MTVKAAFPYTVINAGESYASEQSSAATSALVKTNKTVKTIPSYFAIPSSLNEKKNLKLIAAIMIPSGLTVIPEGSKGVARNYPSLSMSKVKLAYIEYNVGTLSKVKPAYIKQEIDSFTFPTIPSASPVYPLQSLQTGWDGYWAEPLSQKVLLRAHDLWMQIKQITCDKGDLPGISPAANGSVAFTWSSQYPRKELEIWLYDQPDYYAEWLLSVEGNDVEGDTQSQAELLKVIRQYQES